MQLVKKINKKELIDRLPATEVAKKYLGTPEYCIGGNAYYPTPFRKNVISKAPLQVSEKWIIDRGGDFKGDIIKFVAELHHVRYREAIELLAKDFNITGLQNYFSTYDAVRGTYIKKEEEKIVLESSNVNVESIKMMFDTVAFNVKPSGAEIAEIKNRIDGLKMTTYSLENIKYYITRGHTSIPAGIKGEAKKNWKEQQVFMVDIDNVEKVNGKNEKILASDERHITVQKAVQYCEMIGLVPTFIYKTFSYTDECQKLRLVYILDEPVTDLKLAKQITDFLREKLSPLNIDEAPTQPESLFFGGKEIAYCSYMYYKPVKKMIDVSDMQYEINYDYGEYNKYIDKLAEIGYGINACKLCKVMEDKVNGIQYIPISNFVPIIIKQTTYSNDKDNNTFYKLKGVLLKDGTELPEITVGRDELEKTSYYMAEEWKLQAIKEPAYGVDERIKYVTQSISQGDIICEKVYAHTGFIRIDGKLVYLYHGGVIGDVKNLQVDLSLDKLEQYHFSDIEYLDDLDFVHQNAIRTSASIIDVAPPEITVPLIATVYLAPLRSLLSENGLLADFIVWIEGKTGTRKSSLAAVALSHFGHFQRNSFPNSFRDTANSLEKKTFILKDSLNVVDDYCPEVVGTGKTGTAEKLFAMYGDRTGRDRMSSDGKTLRGSYTARGLCIVTGETFPKVAQSRLARTILLNMKPGNVDLKKLKDVQNDIDYLSKSMRLYIEWIINNEKFIIDFAKEQQEMLELEFQDENLHGRTSEATIMLMIGYKIFLQFQKAHNVIDDLAYSEKEKWGVSILKEIAEEQNQEIQVENPVEMFAEAVVQMYASERVQIIDYDIPCNTNSRTTLVGFYDGTHGFYYFIPDTIYKEVVKFYREQGIKFPVTKRTLIKMLYDEGYLFVPSKSDRKTVKRRAPNTDVFIPVLAIYQDKLGLESVDRDKETAECNILVKEMQEGLAALDKRRKEEKLEEEKKKLQGEAAEEETRERVETKKLNSTKANSQNENVN